MNVVGCPKNIILDFEIALLCAIRNLNTAQAVPIKLIGCFYHFKNCLGRQVCNL